MTGGEGPLLDLARQGHNFARLCEAAAMLDEPDTTAARMAAHLRGWLENGMISAMGRATARDPA